MRSTPDLSPTYPARIFCLARGGDWRAAALTLQTAEALGILSKDEDTLLALFLDAEIGIESPRPPLQPTPLTYRLYEAVGAPLPTAPLPPAFAQADLRAISGWKARAGAAERLVRLGALSPEEWREIWLEREPAASGGIWDRISTFRGFDAALEAGDTAVIIRTLPAAWSAAQKGGTDVPFAELYGDRLRPYLADEEIGALAFRIGLLSPAYEKVAAEARPRDSAEELLAAIARGDPAEAPAPDSLASDPLRQAIRDGFAANAVPERLRGLVEDGRIGEAILQAVSLTSEGAAGDLDHVVDALALLRSLGLEDTARRTALQLLLTGRRE